VSQCGAVAAAAAHQRREGSEGAWAEGVEARGGVEGSTGCMFVAIPQMKAAQVVVQPAHPTLRCEREGEGASSGTSSLSGGAASARVARAPNASRQPTQHHAALGTLFDPGAACW
jgi:hypothetical protein